MLSQKQQLDRLDELVDEGLYAYNLWEMQRLSAGLIAMSGYPSVFYVLQNILVELAESWEDRPVVSARYEPVHERLVGPIHSILSAVRGNMEAAETLKRLDLLVHEFSEVQPELTTLSE